MKKASTIVFLNGTSSSGKSTILRAIQALSPLPFLDMGLDKFLWMLPKKYLDIPLWQTVFTYSYEEDGKTIREIRAGGLGHKLVSTMHQSILTASETGMNILADHVLLEKAWVKECAELFAKENAYLIGIRCPLTVLEERERFRKDRTFGQARAQYVSAHEHCLYDFEVDTSITTAERCAKQILAFTEKDKPKAFQKLKQLLP